MTTTVPVMESPLKADDSFYPRRARGERRAPPAVGAAPRRAPRGRAVPPPSAPLERAEVAEPRPETAEVRPEARSGQRAEEHREHADRRRGGRGGREEHVTGMGDHVPAFLMRDFRLESGTTPDADSAEEPVAAAEANRSPSRRSRLPSRWPMPPRRPRRLPPRRRRRSRAAGVPPRPRLPRPPSPPRSGQRSGSARPLQKPPASPCPPHVNRYGRAVNAPRVIMRYQCFDPCGTRATPCDGMAFKARRGPFCRGLSDCRAHGRATVLRAVGRASGTAVPAPGGVEDAVDPRVPRLPAEGGARARDVGDEDRRVARDAAPRPRAAPAAPQGGSPRRGAPARWCRRPTRGCGSPSCPSRAGAAPAGAPRRDRAPRRSRGCRCRRA